MYQDQESSQDLVQGLVQELAQAQVQHCSSLVLVLHQEYRETGNRKYLNLSEDEHLVRLHIGLEDPNDLIADIKQALKYLK